MRKLIHLDMDAFYVSVEIRDNPELEGLPVAVGGNRGSRGVLSTSNYIARQFGVRSAMPSSIALQKCPDLIIVPGRMSVYKEVSAQIREIMERYTDLIEPLSLDEAFLDVSDCKLFNGSATLIAQDIRKTIQTELNLTASAGVSSLKFLAKIASDENKPNGQYVITPSDVISFIEDMTLEKIPGVGKVTANKLHTLGLFTGKDIRQSSIDYLQSQLGKFGVVLWERCQGVDNRHVETSRIRKSVGVEQTFVKDISNENDLRALMITKLIPELTKRAKKDLLDRTISKLGVKVKFSDFQQTTKEYKHHDLDDEIFTRLLLEAISRGEGRAVRLIGVHIGLSEPQTGDFKQIEFSWL